MARKQNANFLKQHYDKILVVASLLLLVGSLAALVSGTSAANAERNAFRRDMEGMKPVNPRADRISDFTYAAAGEMLENPYAMPTGGTFLVTNAEQVESNTGFVRYNLTMEKHDNCIPTPYSEV